MPPQDRPVTAPTSDAADSTAVANERLGTTGTATFQTLLTQARDVIILALRDYFQNDTRVPANFRYSDEECDNKVFISDQNPDEIRLFPCIKVQNSEMRQVNMDFTKFATKQQYTDADGFPVEYTRKVGKYEVTWNLIVVAKWTTERDILSDLVVDCLEFGRFNTIQENGVIFLPSTVFVSNDDTIQWDETTPLERKVVSFRTWLEWYHDETVIGPYLSRIYSRTSFNQTVPINPDVEEVNILAPK